MCTVTYIPLQKSVLLSSVRDESPLRKLASQPAIVPGKIGNRLYPADGVAGGTWIGMAETGYLLILLNGAFNQHVRKDSYRLSRGLIVKDLLDSMDPVMAWQKGDLTDIEPFTMVVYANKKLEVLVWDGNKKHHLYPNPKVPHIWSSATLYSENAVAMRLQWFQSFLSKNPQPCQQDVMDFLLFNPVYDLENGFYMNRQEVVKTISISLVEMKEKVAFFDYYDLLQPSQSNHLRFKFNRTINNSNELVEENKVATLVY